MSNRDADKKPASKSTSVPLKPDAELQDNELDQISGGVAMATHPTTKSNKPQNSPLD